MEDLPKAIHQSWGRLENVSHPQIWMCQLEGASGVCLVEKGGKLSSLPPYFAATALPNLFANLSYWAM
jgi:hypothetical protein